MTQTALIPNPGEVLQHSQWVVHAEKFEPIEFDPNERMNITMLAGRLGTAMASKEDSTWELDPALNVSAEDYGRAYPDELAKVLIIPKGDPRRKMGNPRLRMMIVIDSGKRTLSEEEAPGVVGEKDGVIINAEEYDYFVRSGVGLADKVESDTLSKYKDDPNVEYRDNRVSIHVGESMDKKIGILDELDEQLIAQRALLWRVNRDSRIVWRTSYLAKNLDRDRREADELIHDIISTAALNLDLGNSETAALHNAAVSNMYRRGSSAELSQAWKTYTGTFGRYKNSIRGKVSQSKSACITEIQNQLPYQLQIEEVLKPQKAKEAPKATTPVSRADIEHQRMRISEARHRVGDSKDPPKPLRKPI